MPTPDLVFLPLTAVVVLVVLAVLGAPLFTVDQRTTAIVQRLGRFLREAGPGFHVKLPFIDRVVARVSMRVQQLEVEIETKTKGDEFIRVRVAVQYFVNPTKAYDAFYALSEPHRQITAFVLDAVRAQIPRMTLRDVFDKKDILAKYVEKETSEAMAGSGYLIREVLVTDVTPDALVKASILAVNAARNLRGAATGKGGAADDSHHVVGVPDTTARELLDLVLTLQCFEMLEWLGAPSRDEAGAAPRPPSALDGLIGQMRRALFESVREAGEAPSTAPLPDPAPDVSPPADLLRATP